MAVLRRTTLPKKDWHETTKARLADRKVSSVLLVSSLTSIIILPLIADLPQFSSFTGNFVLADLYKISLFANGQSPYSISPWAASYPPLYFMIWVLPYFVATATLSSVSQVYPSFQILSMILMGLVSFLIYVTLMERNHPKTVAISYASIFLLCSVTALLSLVGDAFGLLFLASGCYLLNKGRDLWGIFFVSLSIAFKVHPIIGAVAILAYFLFARRRFLFKKSLVVFAGTVAVFAAIPILLIPQAYDSVVGFHAVNLQMYTFNLYSGLLDTFSDLASSSTSFVTDLKNYLDYGWLTAVLGAAFYLCWLVAKKVRYLRLASPVDLLSIGIMLWLVLLKQTLPHYFLWALLPLLAMGRLKSSLYLVAGESLGLGFFSLGYFLNQGSQIQYWVLPGMSSSLAFLAGGVSFVLFDLLAMKSLIKDIESQKEVAEDRRIAILSQSIQK